MRRIYDYLSIEQKIKVVAELKSDLQELVEELMQNKEYTKLVRDILYSTKDSWTIEIHELEEEIKRSTNN
ncbi:hypothetical protein ACE1TH_06105 [Shouchella sp. JSM 1781072]|uniref:hypothetical protein n=1 Tax=Bacillaceae TaxID=186817 RepID=UPI000C06FFDB|nr:MULTISPECIES: hypothetical protein [Bacillaceae]UTR08275.1 hypothetical protein MM326_09760 [Alkalihalobacillus sp. LMS6]